MKKLEEKEKKEREMVCNDCRLISRLYISQAVGGVVHIYRRLADIREEEEGKVAAGENEEEDKRR